MLAKAMIPLVISFHSHRSDRTNMLLPVCSCLRAVPTNVPRLDDDADDEAIEDNDCVPSCNTIVPLCMLRSDETGQSAHFWSY